MRTPTSGFALLEPRSLQDALRLLRDEPTLVPLAGCTDLFVSFNFGATAGPRYLNLWPIDSLRRIHRDGDILSIGALATFSDLIGSPLVRSRLPMLAAAAREIGAVQIQNRGRLGGNIFIASPAGDSLPVLAVAEATLVLRNAGGVRRVPFTSFYTAYRRTVMKPDELLVAVEIPPVEGRQWFRKVGTRAAQAIAKVVMAGVRAPSPRIAFGSVAPTVVRAPKAEAVLAAGGSIAEAQAALQSEIHPIDDVRSTAAYRRRVAANLLAAFWRQTAPEEQRP